ncbi:YhcN/YlaJ family sporulation lipoprotein [Virgibacillus sp. W0181]|uniref:YhcN/YlaJ family sporulation lipoprotein n=1 Tax=Virgibacillus sp. W0181 TaxID=3391581 RepID=UPI003F44DFF3
MKLLITFFAVGLFVLTGCANGNDDAEQKINETNPDLIRYESKEEQNARFGINEYADKDYYQSDEKGIALDGNESKLFNSKEARLITQKLHKRTDIKQSQVATIEDTVIVSVTLKDYTNDNITNSIKQDVQEIVPAKEVIIYTDDIHWNRMRNLQSGLKQREIGENLEHYLEDNFNIRLKD